MLVALHPVGVAAVPLNLTVLVPCVAPKFAPVIATEVPTRPDAGLRPEMVGAAAVVAPAGTCTTMLVAPQLVGVAAVPLNLTVLDPCVAPKFVPVIVTDVPTG